MFHSLLIVYFKLLYTLSLMGTAPNPMG